MNGYQDDDGDFLYSPQRARGERLDPALRMMALGAGGVALAVILLALAWSGASPGGFGPPPVITPPDTPLRVAPADPGGLQVPGADMPILSGQSPGTAPQLAPAPATPQITQLDQAAGLNQLPPAPAAAPTAPPVPTPAANAAQPTTVQLAARPDEISAQSAWENLRKKFPDLLAGKTPLILPAVVNGQSVWRLRLPGFSSAADAKAFCAKLAGAPCTVLP